MGLSPFKSCMLGSDNALAVVPNPNPGNWKLISLQQFKNAYVLKVKYPGCTNFEGVKIMVYTGNYVHQDRLDPHFSADSKSPIARFRPDNNGWALACAVAEAIK